MKRFLGYIIDKGIKAIPRKKKVSPTIKSVKPTKDVKGSVKRTKSDEYVKRITTLESANEKVKEGRKMMREGQKERKKMVDTGRAFQFKHSKSYHAIQPGDKPEVKYKGNVRKQKMGGGMMGRRFGYKGGKLVGNQKKIDVAAPFGTINEKDFKKLREGKRMQAKGGTDPFLNKKEDPMRDRMKQPLKLKRSKELMLEDLKKSKFKKRKP